MRQLICCTILALSVCSLRAQEVTISTAAASTYRQITNQLGWNSALCPGDAVATGTITFPEDRENAGLSAGITVKQRGSQSASVEIDYSGVKRTIFLKSGTASSGFKGRFAATRSPRSLFFPCMVALMNASTTGVNVTQLPNEKLGDRAHQVFEVAPADGFATDRSLNTIKLWFAADTGLLTQLEYRKATDGHLNFMPILRKFSSYKPVNGVMVPLHQEEWSQVEILNTIVFQDVTFNVGLTDSDFVVSSEVK